MSSTTIKDKETEMDDATVKELRAGLSAMLGLDEPRMLAATRKVVDGLYKHLGVTPSTSLGWALYGILGLVCTDVTEHTDAVEMAARFTVLAETILRDGEAAEAASAAAA